MNNPLNSQEEFFDEQGLPPHLKEIYEELTKRGYREETMEEFVRFSLDVARYRRTQVEGRDMKEAD